MGGKPWTEEEDALLAELAADGYTAEEIAAELGKSSRFAVYKRADRTGVRFPRKDHVDPMARSLVISLLTRGMTAPEIAEYRGVTGQSVRGMIAELVKEKLVREVGLRRSPRYAKGWRAKVYQPTAKWYSPNGSVRSDYNGRDDNPESYDDVLDRTVREGVNAGVVPE